MQKADTPSANVVPSVIVDWSAVGRTRLLPSCYDRHTPLLPTRFIWSICSTCHALGNDETAQRGGRSVRLRTRFVIKRRLPGDIAFGPREAHPGLGYFA